MAPMSISLRSSCHVQSVFLFCFCFYCFVAALLTVSTVSVKLTVIRSMAITLLCFAVVAGVTTHEVSTVGHSQHMTIVHALQVNVIVSCAS